MSANSPQKPLAIKTWIDSAARQLVSAGISSGRLDAEIILAHTLHKGRTFLHAHDDENLPIRERNIADARLMLRLDRTPIAYIIGHKDFYGRPFRVTPATLVPRPESEMIITILKERLRGTIPLFEESSPRLVDVGTGTGCLGITAKIELPELTITLLDISKHALKVAEDNARRLLKTNVEIVQSDLLVEYPYIADFIVANLPYVDVSWEHSPETDYEPELALYAKDGGLRSIYKLLEQAGSHLKATGILILEADPRQHTALIKHAKTHGFSKHSIRDFAVVLQKA